MFCKKFSLVAGMSFALVVLSAVSAPSARAQQPVIRTFGFYATGSLVGPDFTSDESKVVTALPDAASPSTGQLLEFSTSEENPEWLRGTRWIVVPAHHATKHNDAMGGVFLWLVNEDIPDLPPVGANAVTGPNGNIVDQVSYRIAPCNGDCGLGEGSEVWRVVTGTGQGTAFVVVTALFSR